MKPDWFGSRKRVLDRKSVICFETSLSIVLDRNRRRETGMLSHSFVSVIFMPRSHNLKHQRIKKALTFDLLMIQ